MHHIGGNIHHSSILKESMCLQRYVRLCPKSNNIIILLKLVRSKGTQIFKYFYGIVEDVILDLPVRLDIFLVHTLVEY